MASMSLDELGERVSKKYAPFDIPMGEAGTLRLRQVLMIPPEQRVKFLKVQKELNALAEDKLDDDGKVIEQSDDELMALEPQQIEKFRALFSIVADDQALLEVMLAQPTKDGQKIGDSLVSLNELFEAYGESTEAGEASASPSS